MTKMVQVIGGKITKYQLPKVGKLNNGTTVSGYNLLPLETLTEEGWLLLEDNIVEYDINTQYVIPRYTVHSNKVSKNYDILEIEKDTIEVMSVALRGLIRVDELTPEELGEMIDLYPKYVVNNNYLVGDILKYEGKLYKVIQAHTSLENWLPSELPALYLNLMPENVIPEWVQPLGGHDAYKIGDKVIFEGKVYESTIDNNAWSPTGYPQGWKVV